MANTAKNGEESPKYKDGDIININNEDFRVVRGKLVPLNEQKEEKHDPSFNLIFKKFGGIGFRKHFTEDDWKEFFNKIKKLDISEDNKSCEIDIYPLLAFLFGTDRVEIYSFAGCKYQKPGEIGERKIMFGDSDFDKMGRAFDELIDSVFTNSKQATSFKSLTHKTLYDPFIDFGHLLW